MMDDDECGAVGRMIGKGNQSTRKKTCLSAAQQWWNDERTKELCEPKNFSQNNQWNSVWVCMKYKLHMLPLS
jgi:hypothetical protein